MTDRDRIRKARALEHIELDGLGARVADADADAETHLKVSHATTNADRVAGAEAAQATLSRPEWIERFGSQLMKLQPTLNAVAAAAQAVAAYPARCAVKPEEAAKAAFEGSQLL